MKVDLSKSQVNRKANIATRCPHCGHNGTFKSIAPHDVSSLSEDGRNVVNILCIRQCPNEKCNGHLFVITNLNNDILHTSPSDSVPFDKENIPANVLAAFEEAVKCHADSCFIASAIMIRKTLEEICHDRKVKGDNLQKRLAKLGKVILIPKELLDGMDDLRLLGNDAAHIEARTFNEIGKDEIEISLEFTKEILKAVYQYNALLNKLKKLKAKADEE